MKYTAYSGNYRDNSPGRCDNARLFICLNRYSDQVSGMYQRFLHSVYTHYILYILSAVRIIAAHMILGYAPYRIAVLYDICRVPDIFCRF